MKIFSTTDLKDATFLKKEKDFVSASILKNKCLKN